MPAAQTMNGGKKAFVPASDTKSLMLGAPAGVGVSAMEICGIVHKTRIVVKNLVVSMVDAGAAGSQGSQKVYDFPEGAIQILGAQFNLTTQRVGTNIQANAALVGSVGSAAAGAGDATLTGTEADIVPSTVGTLVSGAGTLKKNSVAPAAPFDGTTTPVDAILNLAVPDAGSAGNDSITVNGTIHLFWIMLGDY